MSLEQDVLTEVWLGRRGRLRTYVFETASAVAFPLLGVSYLLNPGSVALHSAVGRRVYPLDYIWSVGYIVAGLMILTGILGPRLRARSLGLIVLGTCLLMQAGSAFVLHPEVRSAFNVVYALAAFLRAHLMIKLFTVYRRMPPVHWPSRRGGDRGVPGAA